MNTNINAHAQAYQRFRAELAEAVKWSNPDYTNSAITRERARRVMEARKNLLAAVPAEATATGQTPAEYIDSLRPTTADQVAVAQFEWGQAKALLDSGRSLDQVIHAASPARLRAVAAYIDTLPDVVSSIVPDEVVAEVKSLVFDRLAESGDEGAAQVRAAHRSVAAPNAWRRVLSEALEGQPSLGAQTELHQADPEGWAGIDRSEFASADIDVDQRVQALDRVVRLKAVT